MKEKVWFGVGLSDRAPNSWKTARPGALLRSGFSHAAGVSLKSEEGTRVMTQVRCPLNEAANISRHEAALIVGDREITYAQLDALVYVAADRLRSRGCGADERVALCVPETWQTAALLLALLRIRAVACLLDPAWPSDLCAQVLRALDCRRIVTGPERRDLPSGVCHWTAEDLLNGTPVGISPYDRPTLTLEQPATIVVHIDSTRSVRGIQHSFGSHYYGALGANHQIRASSGARWLLAAPLHQANGLSVFFRCLIGGSALVVPPADLPLEEAVRRHRITHVSLPAARAEALLNGVDGGGGPLRAVVVEDGALSPAMRQRAAGAQLPLFASYHVAEMASDVTSLGPGMPPSKGHTSGMVLKYREVRITEDGEILVRGPTLFSGYVEHQVLRRPVDAEGWFATGDRGRMDEEGYLHVQGRKSAGDPNTVADGPEEARAPS